jgi:uncharacterized protein YvpB
VVESPVVVVPAPPSEPQPPVAPALQPARRVSRRAIEQAGAVLIVVAVLVGLATGSPRGDAIRPLALQARALALNDTWVQMVADGVRSADLAEMRAEWRLTQQSKVQGAAAIFWWPDGAALMDRWQIETDRVWSRNLSVALTGATVAELSLHRELGAEAPGQRAWRLGALATATTPAELTALGGEWALQARLVPLDRSIADALGQLTPVVQQATGLGIVTNPAPGLLARAAEYVSLDESARLTRARMLWRDLGRANIDLSARVASARLAKQAFARANHAISVADTAGVSVAAYRSRVDANSRTYATAITPDQFAAVSSDLDQVAGSAHHDLVVWMSQVHIVGGVAFYYQSHGLSCEEAATSMALTHQGIYLSQDRILAEMGADLRPPYWDARGVMHWGDPYVSFVGNVNGVENVTGWGANYAPLVRVALAHHAWLVQYGYMTAQTIYMRLAAGHPVVVYATFDWAWHPRHDYIAFDGRRIPFIGPAQSHVYTAVGVRPDAVLVNDPWRGQYWVAKGSFEAAYSDFMEAIVFA